MKTSKAINLVLTTMLVIIFSYSALGQKLVWPASTSKTITTLYGKK